MHTTYSYSKTRQSWDNPAQKGAGSRLGFALTGDSDATPRIEFSGAAGLSPYGHGDSKVANGLQNNTQYHISQGYTLLKGKHEYKFGWAYRRFLTLGQDLANTNGRYTFNRVQTGSPTALTSTGHEFASLLLGGVDRAVQVVPPVLFDTTMYHDTSVYFQDNWKLTSKLTVNLGMRYEVPIGWHVPGGNGYSMVDIKVPNPAAGGLPGALVFSGTGPGLRLRALLPDRLLQHWTAPRRRLPAGTEDGSPRWLVHLLPGPVERWLRLPCGLRRFERSGQRWPQRRPELGQRDPVGSGLSPAADHRSFLRELPERAVPGFDRRSGWPYLQLELQRAA